MSKFGKLFPYFKEEIEKEELEKPRPKVKRRGEISILTTGENNWKDYSVEFKVRADYNQSKFGIAVRYNEENQSGYYLWIEQIKQNKAKLPLNYKIFLERRLNEKSEILQQTIYTNNLKWFIIEVMVEGERIEVEVDGKRMIAVKDSEIERGKVAIISEQRLPLTVIDDFIVKALSKKGVFGKKENGKNNQLNAQNLESTNPDSSESSTFNGIQSATNSPNISDSASESPYISRISHLSRFSLSSDLSRFSRPSIEKGPSEGNDSSSELNEPINSLTPDFSPDPIYQTTSSLPANEIILYYHHDHLGNVRAVADQSGNVVERHDFYPFGEEITHSQSKDQYLFLG